MKRNVMGAAARALALCLLFAACGGQGALPVSPDAPPETPAQSSEADGTSPAPPEQPEASGPEEAPPPEEEDPEKLVKPEKPEKPEKEETPAAPQNTEAEDPQENTALQSTGAKNPQENAAAQSTEAKKWQAVTISAADFGVTENPIGDPGVLDGIASLSLGKLIACSLASDGAAAEGLNDELWRRFLEDPDRMLVYLELMGDQRDGYWEHPAAEVVCQTIACADAAWYNSVEFGEILSDRRVRYSVGRIAELLDVMEREHAAGLERNGWQGAEPTQAPPRETPLENWQAISIDLTDYGLTGTLSDPRFEYIFNHGNTVPLDQLVVFDLWGDALTEGSSEELRSRFLEDPDTVLAFLALMGNQRVGYWDRPPAANVVCRHIASADAAWHGGTEEFAQVLADCRTAYPAGRIAELLDVLAQEHAASMARNHPTA